MLTGNKAIHDKAFINGLDQNLSKQIKEKNELKTQSLDVLSNQKTEIHLKRDHRSQFDHQKDNTEAQTSVISVKKVEISLPNPNIARLQNDTTEQKEEIEKEDSIESVNNTQSSKSIGKQENVKRSANSLNGPDCCDDDIANAFCCVLCCFCWIILKISED